MPHFALSWVAGPSASSQTIQYRVKDSGTWVTNSNISPANPQNAATTSASISGLSNNVIYQFQVLSNCCPGTSAAGLVLENVIFGQQTVTTSSSAGVLTVNQNPMTAVDSISYRLATQNAPGVTLQTLVRTGEAPNGSFTAVSAGNYIVTYAYTSTINGVTVNSYDAGQANAWYSTGVIQIS